MRKQDKKKWRESAREIGVNLRSLGVGTVLGPLVVGIGLGVASYFILPPDGPSAIWTTISWGILAWVSTTVIAVIFDFLFVMYHFTRVAIETKRATTERLDALENRVEATLAAASAEICSRVSHEVMRSALELRDTGTVARHVSDLFAECSRLGPFLYLAERFIDAAVPHTFTKEGIIKRYGVGDAEYCSLLMEACNSARESIHFTCLESPYWFMVGHESRQVHLQAMNRRDLPKRQKVRVIALASESEQELLDGSDELFESANALPQLEAVHERDKLRWASEPPGESEVSWFERQSDTTTLYWTTTARLPERLVRLGDYGVLDGALYLSYDFRNGILSCSWNPAVIDSALEIFREAGHEAEPETPRSIFFDRFWDLPTIPEDVRARYCEEERAMSTESETPEVRRD